MDIKLGELVGSYFATGLVYGLSDNSFEVLQKAEKEMKKNFPKQFKEFKEGFSETINNIDILFNSTCKKCKKQNEACAKFCSNCGDKFK